MCFTELFSTVVKIRQFVKHHNMSRNVICDNYHSQLHNKADGHTGHAIYIMPCRDYIPCMHVRPCTKITTSTQYMLLSSMMTDDTITYDNINN